MDRIEPAHETHFWRIIEAAWQKCSSEYSSCLYDDVLKAMEPLATETLLSFHLLFERLLAKAFTRDLWGACKLYEAGDFADDFTAFVLWLVGHGKKTYESIFREPDDLVSLSHGSGAQRDWDYPRGDTIHGIPAHCLRGRMATAPKEPTLPGPSTAFEAWTPVELRSRFPRLWRLYGSAFPLSSGRAGE